MYEGQKAQEKQRILEYSWVDVCTNLVSLPGEAHGDDCKYKNRENNFKKRLFVLTNHGIHLMKDLPPEQRCQNCTYENFCPRGPIQEQVVKITDIQSTINFPNML